MIMLSSALNQIKLLTTNPVFIACIFSWFSAQFVKAVIKLFAGKVSSIKELFERVKNEVNEIARKHTGKTVLIATHATPIRAMSTLWFKKNIEDIRDIDWVKNASVTVVNYDDIENPEVLLYDEHKHLNDILTELPSTI